MRRREARKRRAGASGHVPIIVDTLKRTFRDFTTPAIRIYRAGCTRRRNPVIDEDVSRSLTRDDATRNSRSPHLLLLLLVLNAARRCASSRSRTPFRNDERTFSPLVPSLFLVCSSSRASGQRRVMYGPDRHPVSAVHGTAFTGGNGHLPRKSRWGTERRGAPGGSITLRSPLGPYNQMRKTIKHNLS